MRIVVDGLPLRGTSVSIVTQHLLEAWDEVDELHLVCGRDSGVATPARVVRHEFDLGPRRMAGRLRRQNVDLPRLCRRIAADALFAPLPSTAVTPVPCAVGVLHHDLRHELRPEQFGRGARAIRQASYSACFRRADAIACISERSRADLLRSRPFLRGRDVRVVHHGADHVEPLRAMPRAGGYALAFGQYRNKNVDLVLDAWAGLAASSEAMPLHIVGLDETDRRDVAATAANSGLGKLVEARPWLSEDEFQREFAGAGMVVFVSDFEGFGLPALEAMALEIPLVVSPEPALREVTAGLAHTSAGWTAHDVADAVRRARRTTPAQLQTARAHADRFTWRRSAAALRDMLAAASARRRERQ